MRPRSALAAWAVLALVCSAAAAAAGPPPLPAAAAAALEAGAEAGELPSLAEQQYWRALEIRDMQDATQRELKQAAKLLYSAAGIQHLSLVRPTAAPAKAGGPSASSSSGSSSSAGSGGAALEGGFLTAANVNLVLRNDTPPHLGAIKELVYVYREGDGVPVNPAIAHRLLLLLAELGNAEAQADAAFHLALGVEPVAPNSRDQVFRLVPPDVPAALVHYTFSARAGDPVAQMSLGYRHLQGIGVPKSCQTAALYYAPVAEKVLDMAQLRESLPQIKSMRLSYKTAHARRPSLEQEVLHYQWFADFGNVDAARAVAHMLSHGAARDYEQAIRYLRQAAGAGDADAMAHLGHIHANGIGVPQDNSTAMSWFWKAAERGHASGFFGLGYMYMAGHGADKNYGKALKYLKEAAAAGQGVWTGQGDAFFYLGLMHLKGWGTKPDAAKAIQLFDAAAKSGNMLAAYNLAMLHLGGHTVERAPCQAAVALLKKVAEKGFPAQQEANDDFQAGDYEWALLNYLKAAEMGAELGQSNAAWMLSEGYGYEGPEAGQAALRLYKRAAQQGNVEALLHIGDGYWYGKQGVGRDWRRASQMYGEAGKHSNAQALFNMGLMHQFGAGLPRDFHLAKRFYDRSLTAQSDAQLAVQLALHFLRLHTWWEGVQHRLPPQWAARIGRLFTLPDLGGDAAQPAAAAPASAAAAGVTHHPSPRHSLWARARRLLTLDSLFDSLDELFELGDNLDLTVAAGLLLMLALVLWRRRMLRLQAQARQFVQAAPGGGGDRAGAAAVAAAQQWAQDLRGPPVASRAGQPQPAAVAAPAAATAAGPAAPAPAHQSAESSSSGGDGAESSSAAGDASGAAQLQQGQ